MPGTKPRPLGRVDYAPAIKRALSDPTRVLEALGILGEGRSRQRQTGGWMVRCVVHADGTPSMSVQARDGVLLWKCHACDAGGDVLSLIAAARGLRVESDFRQVLLEGARLAGLWAVVDELQRPGPSADRPRLAPQPPQESVLAPERPRAYPDGADALWGALRPVTEDSEVSFYLVDRAIDPDRVESRDLARVLPPTGALPAWARYQGHTWRETGHRLIVPAWDATGVLRSFRAWRVVVGETPKRLPPGGCKASDLVLADSFGLAMLRGHRSPERVIVAEGEPNAITWMVRLNEPDTATIGIWSGSWSASLADRFPIGSHVIVRTDRDQAGDRYYDEIRSGLRRRCFVSRGP